MKKILSLLTLILVCSCSTSSDDTGNSNTSVVPLAPTGLAANVVSPTQINLSWTDNSTNETGFKIQRKTSSESYAIVGNANTDVLTFSDTGLLPSTTYTYRVYSYNAAGNSPTYSNEVTVTTSLPTLTTTAVTSIITASATSGGTITSDGGAAITTRGVCWSTNANPTVALITKTTNGAGTGAFTSIITGLTAGTTYYVRAYATNSVGTAYGNQVSFTTLQNTTGIYISGPNVTDIDGNSYQSVTNCGLTFTKQNLNVSKYSDGTPIPQVQDPTAWANLTTGAWCYYNNDPAYGAVYGKLYNWYAVAGIYNAASAANPALRKILAPTGWNVPSDVAWSILINCLDYNANGGNSANVAGGKMKSTGTLQAGTGLWKTPNEGASNTSGFTGLPGGTRNPNGFFLNVGNNGYWWSLSENGTQDAWYRYLDYGNGNAYRNFEYMKDGFSVRLIEATTPSMPNVTVGTQVWSSTNLNVSTYRDGTPIPQITNPAEWFTKTTGAWCYYANNTANGTTYGKLYNWYAVAGIHDNDLSTPNKILAPQGWHIPSDAEWTTLTTFLGGEFVAGGKMKSTGTSLWVSPNIAATNESGFNGLPAGSRVNNGAFGNIGGDAVWWSSSEFNTTNAWFRQVLNNSGFVFGASSTKAYGFSVRCLRD